MCDEGGKARGCSELRVPHPDSAPAKSAENPRYEQTPRLCGLEEHGGPLPLNDTSSVEELRGSRDQSMPEVEGVFSKLLGGHGANIPEGSGFGQEGQQRGLHPGELPVGYSARQFDEQAEHREAGGCRGVKQSNGDTHKHSVLSAKNGVAVGEDIYPTDTSEPAHKRKVYDIYNAGPRSRFVVLGDGGPFIVHNCSQALARLIIGQQMLMIARRYRVTFTVHDSVVPLVPEDQAEEGQKFIEACMRTRPKWATGLPLNCESKIGKTYGG